MRQVSNEGLLQIVIHIANDGSVKPELRMLNPHKTVNPPTFKFGINMYTYLALLHCCCCFLVVVVVIFVGE